MINDSVVLTGAGALAGFIVLCYQISVFKRCNIGSVFITMPILLGTLAWLTACYEFSVFGGSELSIEVQRAVMVISWIWLSGIAVTKKGSEK